jgi:ribose 5-phosphate isomerase B
VIALGCDHGGFLLKNAIKNYFDEKNIKYKDFGTDEVENSVDYPKYAYLVAKSVANGECEKGILFCGTGIGVSIAANKVSGIRAAVCQDEFSTEMTRRHNDANVLCLGGRVIDENKAISLANIFLNTPFDRGRHYWRVLQIEQIEKGTFKI